MGSTKAQQCWRPSWEVHCHSNTPSSSQSVPMSPVVLGGTAFSGNCLPCRLNDPTTGIRSWSSWLKFLQVFWQVLHGSTKTLSLSSGGSDNIQVGTGANLNCQHSHVLIPPCAVRCSGAVPACLSSELAGLCDSSGTSATPVLHNRYGW